MVVKKFEARSMKEALDMIKAEMGPEAIIMAARDNSRRYGLVGEGSVEITAAIHPEKLKQKMNAESRITQELREKIHRGSAKVHKELIEKSTARLQVAPSAQPSPRNSAQQTPPSMRPPVARPQLYIDMEDDVEPAPAPNGVNDKLKMVAQNAWREMKAERTGEASAAIGQLQGEIQSLKEIFKNITELPQNAVKGHPGSEFGLRYEFAQIFEKLGNAGISQAIVVDILKQAQEKMPDSAPKSQAMIIGIVSSVLARRIQICRPEDSTLMEMFIGAGGHGKTSTLIKYAADLALNQQKRVAILTTDTEKFGSAEQLKIYAQILNIPFMVVNDYSQWDRISDETSNFDKILIDSPGVRFRVADEMQKLKKLIPPAYLSPRIHLVLSATCKDQDAIDLGKRFGSIGFDDVIFTALDESSQHGVLINFQEAIGKPYHSFGLGPRVPEDFELATRERIVDLILRTNPESQFALNLSL